MRSFSLLVLGMPGWDSAAGNPGLLPRSYALITDYAATVVFVCMVVAIFRRLVVRPARYTAQQGYRTRRSGDAIFLLVLIAILMFCDSSFFAASQPGDAVALFSFAWLLRLSLASASVAAVWNAHTFAALAARGHVLLFAVLPSFRNPVSRRNVDV